MKGGDLNIDKIAQYREDVDGSYTVFMTELVSAVTGLKVWTSEAQKTTLVSSIVTPSDEALTLLLLMNSMDRWREMHEEAVEENRKEKAAEVSFENGSDNESDTAKKDHPTIGGNSTEDNVTGIKKRKTWKRRTMYTMACKEQQNKEFGGWTNEGKRMYKKILEDVKADRDAHPDWEKKYLKSMSAAAAAAAESKREKNKRPATVKDVEEAVHIPNDLYFSDHEVCGNTNDAPTRSPPDEEESDSEESDSEDSDGEP